MRNWICWCNAASQVPEHLCTGTHWPKLSCSAGQMLGGGSWFPWAWSLSPANPRGQHDCCFPSSPLESVSTLHSDGKPGHAGLTPAAHQPAPMSFSLCSSKWKGCSLLVSGCQAQLLEMWCHSKAAEPSNVGIIEQLCVRCRTFPREPMSSWEELMAHAALWLIKCMPILTSREHSWWEPKGS